LGGQAYSSSTRKKFIARLPFDFTGSFISSFFQKFTAVHFHTRAHSKPPAFTMKAEGAAPLPPRNFTVSA
jgi:hypothetical protein